MGGADARSNIAAAAFDLPAFPCNERYDVVLSRLRNLLRKGLVLHGGGGHRRGTPEEAQAAPPGPRDGRLATGDKERRLRADATIALASEYLAYFLITRGRPQGQEKAARNTGPADERTQGEQLRRESTVYPGVVSALGFVEWRNHDCRGQLEGPRSVFEAIALARASGAYAVALWTSANWTSPTLVRRGAGGEVASPVRLREGMVELPPVVLSAASCTL